MIGQNDEIVHPEPIRKSQRISNPLTHLQDYICSSTTYHIANYASYSQLSPKDQAYALSLTYEVEPANFQAPNKDYRWVAVTPQFPDIKIALNKCTYQSSSQRSVTFSK